MARLTRRITAATPRCFAVGNGHTTCCDLLISEGADIEQAGLMKETPLSRAAHNGHFHTVRFLVENGAVDALDIGITPRCTGPPCAGTSRLSTSRCRTAQTSP